MITNPVIEFCPADGNMILVRPCEIVGILGTYYFTKGYEWDGASVPRGLWWAVGHPYAHPHPTASLVHDWLYATKEATRSEADAEYRYLLIQRGASRLRAFCEYYALRLFGWIAWRSHDHADAHYAAMFGRLVHRA